MSLIPQSLGGRLLLGASGLILAALLITGIAMDFALRRFIQGQIDGRLDGQILTVSDALRLGPDGAPRLERTVDGPPFERPLSGWYWEVLAPGGALRSRSLLSSDFGWMGFVPDDHPRPTTVEGTGPSGEPLRVRVKRLRVASQAVTIAAAAPLRALAGPLHEALAPLMITLLLLGAGLIAGVLLQVRLGLRPLTRLRDELTLVRTGKADRILGPQPLEVRPLVTELNALLDQNEANLERARRHVANLAHGLKTPLATLGLVLSEPGRDLDRGLAPLIETMDRRIRHHLARARTAALGGAARAHARLAPRVADHCEAFAKLYAEKRLDLGSAIDAALAVACETQDLDEMLGNLLDNACRHAKGRVHVAAEASGTRVRLSIEDDGPGLAGEAVTDVMRPGRRIDESAPGYGFGLPITRELAELYGGTLTLSRAEIGGLRVTLDLPKA